MADQPALMPTLRRPPTERSPSLPAGDPLVPLDLEAKASLQRQGRPFQVPGVLYDIPGYNGIATTILDALREAVGQCGHLLVASGDSRYLNLAALYLHEVQGALCSYFFKSWEIDQIGPDARCEYGAQEKAGSSRYLSYTEVNSSDRIASKPPLAPEKSRGPGGLVEILGSVFSGRRTQSPTTKNVLYSPNAALDVTSLKRYLRHVAPGKWMFRGPGTAEIRIHVPRLDEQMTLLVAAIRTIPERLEHLWSGPEGPRLPEELVGWMERSIRNNHGRPAAPLRATMVLIGSPCRLGTRWLAAKARAQGLPVLTILHGESFGAHDEPVFGYSEASYATHLLGYGAGGERILDEGHHARPLFEERPKFFPSRSERIAALHRPNEPVRRMTNWQGQRLLYVPTSFSGIARYGPFRDLHDVAYHEWQLALVSEMRAAGARLTTRLHPKSKGGLNARPADAFRPAPLEDALPGQDAIVFDYVSSAFSLAAATVKPILFFDIGLRNLTPEARRAVEERCIYVRANARDARSAVRRAAAQATKWCTNRFTALYTFPADAPTRVEQTAVALQEAVAGDVLGNRRL